MAAYQSALSKRKTGFTISGAGLKVLALLSMTLDHFAVIIIHNGKLYGYVPEYYQMAISTPVGQRWLSLYGIFRIIGRLSFPIFSFLLVEGFIRSSDFWKYFLRVLCMALLAEVPFDLAFFNETYNFSSQNVGWTLAIGLLTMYAMRYFRNQLPLKWLSIAVGAAIAEFLHFEYGSLAVISMALMYLFRKEKGLRILSGSVCAALNSMEWYCFGAAAFIPIFFYNGERGRFHSRWFFYLYYPLHLLLMYVMIYIGAMITA